MITFKLENKRTVKILCDKKEVGRVAVTDKDNKDNSIIVCGFDTAFDLWGCGIYGDKKTDEMKKDIQLKFAPYELMDRNDINMFRKKIKVGEYDKKQLETLKNIGFEIGDHDKYEYVSRISLDDDRACLRCYNIPCTCENKDEAKMPYTVKREIPK